MITILIVAAVVLTIGLSIALVGRDEIVLSGVHQDGEQAFSIADACAEEGINQLKLNAAYASGSFSLDGGTCDISVVTISGNTKLLTGTGQYKNNLRIIQANVTIKTNVNGNATTVDINSWQEAP